MKIKPDYGKGVVAVPKQALELAGRCPEGAEKALLYLCDHMTDDGCESAGIDRATMDRAIAFWRAAGVIECDAVPSVTEEAPSPRETNKPRESRVPSYTGKEIERIIGARSGLSALLDTAQNMLGKVFTPSEAGVIVMMCDHLELEDEYILLLIEYCRSRGKSSIRYIEKTALTLFDDGIDSVAALDAYIKKREKTDTLESQIRKLYGMGERALTKKEREILTSWAENGVSKELVDLSYEQMIPHVAKPSLSYQNGIITRWRSEGVTSAEQVGKANKAAKGGFDTDEFFAMAVERGKKLLDGEGKKDV